MDFGGLVVLGILWMLFNLLGGNKGARPKPRTLPPPTGGNDPSQQEGSRLEQLLRELERNLEGVAGTQPPAGSGRVLVPQRAGVPPLPSTGEGEEEDVEDRQSLEEPERVISLEDEVVRPRRTAYDHDSEAAALARRRIEAARARDRALSKADHRAFDAKIRQEPADHTAVRQYTPEQLRNAVIWREILGRPVSERDS